MSSVVKKYLQRLRKWIPVSPDVSQTFARFKAALVRKDYDTCTRLLSDLKVAILTNTPEAADELALARDVYDGLVKFQKAKELAPCKEIPYLQLINQTLGYANELQRII